MRTTEKSNDEFHELSLPFTKQEDKDEFTTIKDENEEFPVTADITTRFHTNVEPQLLTFHTLGNTSLTTSSTVNGEFLLI